MLCENNEGVKFVWETKARIQIATSKLYGFLSLLLLFAPYALFPSALHLANSNASPLPHLSSHFILSKHSNPINPACSTRSILQSQPEFHHSSRAAMRTWFGCHSGDQSTLSRAALSGSGTAFSTPRGSIRLHYRNPKITLNRRRKLENSIFITGKHDLRSSLEIAFSCLLCDPRQIALDVPLGRKRSVNRFQSHPKSCKEDSKQDRRDTLLHGVWMYLWRSSQTSGFARSPILDIIQVSFLQPAA
ncbi:hypothetical protein B0J14DRAFT_687938 [Halenospora varia]|nr:hypothetical protein B0J14DRAFT_687938 [Halenospora varia]